MDYSVIGIERLRRDCAIYAANKAMMKLIEILMTPDEDFIGEKPDNFFGTSDSWYEADDDGWGDEEDFEGDEFDTSEDYPPEDFPQPMW